MKKILFMVKNMNIGGTEKALLNMISEINRDEYEVTLLMLERYGEFLSFIPEGIHVEFVQDYKEIREDLNKPLHFNFFVLLKKMKILKAIVIFFIYLLTKIFGERTIFYKYMLRKIPKNKKEYDIAVAYAGPMELISYFIVHKINAKKKIQWIHFDIEHIGFNKNFAKKTYKKFDKIFVVSNEGKNKLVKILPNIKHKTEKFLNVLSPNLVFKMAEDEEESFNDDFCGTRILTVGRLSKEKGQDLTIKVCSRLKKAGYDVRWYCIGDGSERKNYEQLIKDYNLENDYILLGSKPNPYSYMRQSQIYVQPSRHEGYCITLSEARCLQVPIISTNFTGANEQIKHGMTGLLVNFDECEMYEGIKRMLEDPGLRKKLSNNLKSENLDTTNEIYKLYLLTQSLA